MKIQFFQDVIDIIRHKPVAKRYKPTKEEKEMHKDPFYQKFLKGLAGDLAMWKLLKEYKFDSVLDLGAGEGKHSRVFFESGKQVTAISGYDTEDFDEDLKDNIKFIISDYLKYDFPEKFDCIWASHILEHQLNIGVFLNKIHKDLKDNGILAITVPPCETIAGGGHINCFSAGHLIYHLLMAGFDLRQMKLKVYGYNLSVICRKNPLHKQTEDNFCTNLLEKADMLPDYVVESIKRYKKNHPWKNSKTGGHERIEKDLKYRW